MNSVNYDQCPTVYIVSYLSIALCVSYFSHHLLRKMHINILS